MVNDLSYAKTDSVDSLYSIIKKTNAYIYKINGNKY